MSGIRLIIIVFLIACAYALTACGGGSADSTETPEQQLTSTVVPTTNAPNNQPIHIPSVDCSVGTTRCL